MLDALDSRAGRFLDRDTARHMAGERQAELWCFVGDGKERVARRAVVHLDEVYTQGLQILDCLAGLPGVGDVAPERPVRRAVVENGSGRDDFGPEQLAAVDAVAQRQDEVNVGTHVARTDHAVRHK